LMKDVMQELKERNVKLSIYDIKTYINAHFQGKARAGVPTHFSDNQRRQRILKEFSQCFGDALRFYNAVDWADILHYTIELIESHEDIRSEVHQGTQQLLVDEFQDLSPLEQCFVDKIVGDINGLCIFGDDDQNIYETFRFADPQGIIDFQKKYKEAESFYISLCRRCPPEVIECGLKLISNNKKRVPKELMPFNKNKEGFVISLSHKSKIAEIMWLVSKIQDMIKKEFDYRDILILFNDGDIASDYITALKEAKIPLDIQLKVSNIFNSIYFTWLIATIRWVIADGDNLSLRQCLDYWKGIGPETVRQLKLCSLSIEGTLWDAIKNVAQHPKAFKEIRQRNKVITFYDYLSNIKKIKKLSNIIKCFSETIPESKEDKGCKVFSEYLEKFRGKEEFVTLNEQLEDFEDHVDSGYIEDKYKQDSKNVRVMTMHSAKGCESPIVIIPALEDDIIPGEYGNLEEKRRLFYVSITRAKYVAFLSWAYQRSGPEIHKIKGRKRLGKSKSRFLQEMGK
jgi:DNA helicase II / ATP-dependent DNA helicase PcrA